MLLEQPSVVFIAILAAALAACIALLALDAHEGVSAVLNRMIGATKIVVFLDSRMARQDAESVGARLKAEPGIRDALFRSKEEAFSEIEATRKGRLPTPGEIVLPDAWILSLQATASSQVTDMPSLMSVAERLQKTAATLSGVESVRFDRLWIAQLDEWIQLRRDSSTGFFFTVVCVLLVLLLGIFFLANRALSESRAIAFPENSSGKAGVFTYIGFFVAALSGIATFLLHGLAAFALGQLVTSSTGAVQTWLHAFGHTQTQATLTVAAAILVASVSTALVCSRR